jgi:SAM-dependent methyltransferase
MQHQHPLEALLLAPAGTGGDNRLMDSPVSTQPATARPGGGRTVEPVGGPPPGQLPPGSEPPVGTEADPLATWLDSPAAHYLLNWERQQLAGLLADRFGYYAVQLGLPQVPALEANRMPTRLRVGLGCQPADVRVERFDELPFDTQSIDLVVVMHQLESSDRPHRMLREIDRILRPEGILVVAGFNPLSLWGLRHQMNGARLRPVIGPNGQMIGVPRLRDWCKLLGLEVGEGIYGLHAPMCRSQRGFDRMRFLDRAGDRWWPILGAAYIVTAIKRVRGMRLIGPRWRKPVATPSPAVATSNRGAVRRSAVIEAERSAAGTHHHESAVVLPLRRRPLPPAAGRY